MGIDVVIASVAVLALAYEVSKFANLGQGRFGRFQQEAIVERKALARFDFLSDGGKDFRRSTEHFYGGIRNSDGGIIIGESRGVPAHGVCTLKDQVQRTNNQQSQADHDVDIKERDVDACEVVGAY